MVSAYSTIADIGQYHAPQVVEKITDRRGKVLVRFDSAAQPAMSENTALELIDMMRGVINRGTGTEIRNRFAINADVAGKTGTTQYNTDGWFIMAHPALVTGAWVGFNDARVTMRSNYWGQGGHNAITLVGDFYKTLFKNKSLDARARFPKPQRGELMASEPWLERGGSGGGTEGALLVRRDSDGALEAGDAAPAMNGSGNSGSGNNSGTNVGGTAGGITAAGGEPGRSAAEDAVAAARTAARNAIEALQSAGGR
jgi:penicillin-binding protein 1A